MGCSQRLHVDIGSFPSLAYHTEVFLGRCLTLLVFFWNLFCTQLHSALPTRAIIVWSFGRNVHDPISLPFFSPVKSASCTYQHLQVVNSSRSDTHWSHTWGHLNHSWHLQCFASLSKGKQIIRQFLGNVESSLEFHETVLPFQASGPMKGKAAPKVSEMFLGSFSCFLDIAHNTLLLVLISIVNLCFCTLLSNLLFLSSQVRWQIFQNFKIIVTMLHPESFKKILLCQIYQGCIFSLAWWPLLATVLTALWSAKPSPESHKIHT